ncbi:MAG TPA: phospho-N-acetylmuramoyl-pentapeptide-transferase [Firmicutes bacterium]|jgi:phospho-N-acetylmuramoyl-pentapeptide-transferase|nr:phospho-N-acetylmuramoyl-pentapeptide-transferase [Bacillota bacterium]
MFSGLLAFAFSLVFGPAVIRRLQRLKVGQVIRSDGPKTHQAKAGTPTMGGVLIVLCTVAAILLTARPLTDSTVIMLLSTVGFGLIGFLDDYIKVVAKRSLGLRAREKLVGQFGLAALVAIYAASRVGTEFIVPFWTGTITLPTVLYVPFTIFVLVGVVNAVNLTDGLDGLAAGSTAIGAAAFAVIFLLLGHSDLSMFTSALAGACLGFIWFNGPPAQVIMGDTGSFALGAALATGAVLSRTSLFLPIIGGLFVLETVSVMLQVLYFRATKGRRLFRMAPLHHHFELVGWAESKVMIRFVLMSLVFAVLGLYAIL